MSDAINPSHYQQHPSGIECIEITEHLGFCLGNAWKYLHRAGLKDDKLQDFRKALWYIAREYNNVDVLVRVIYPKSLALIRRYLSAQPNTVQRKLYLYLATGATYNLEDAQEILAGEIRKIEAGCFRY